MRSRQNQSGLTLVETIFIMLIVLTVAGSFTIKRIGHQQMLQRDAARKENIRTLSIKLEEYQSTQKSYPSNLSDLQKKSLMSSMPVDPSTNRLYDYRPTPTDCSTQLDNCKAFTLSTKLENSNDKDGDPDTHLIQVKSAPVAQ